MKVSKGESMANAAASRDAAKGPAAPQKDVSAVKNWVNKIFHNLAKPHGK